VASSLLAEMKAEKARAAEAKAKTAKKRRRRVKSETIPTEKTAEKPEEKSEPQQ